MKWQSLENDSFLNKILYIQEFFKFINDQVRSIFSELYQLNSIYQGIGLKYVPFLQVILKI